MSTMRTGTGDTWLARRAEFTVPDTDEPMWTDRISGGAPLGDGLVGRGEPAGAGLGRRHGRAAVPEAGVEGVGVEVDPFEVVHAVDRDRQGHDLHAVPLGQLGRQLGVGVGDQPDHATGPGTSPVRNL